MELRAPALEAQNLSHWTTKKVPFFSFSFFYIVVLYKLQYPKYFSILFRLSNIEEILINKDKELQMVTVFF